QRVHRAAAAETEGVGLTRSFSLESSTSANLTPMTYRITLLGTLAAAALAASPVRAQAPEAETAMPEAAVERLHEQLVAAAEAHGDEPVEARYEALLPAVTATHDLPYIAELTVRREWA